MSADHAFLSPSDAYAWSRCAQRPHMSRRYPQDDTAESVEGTAAHWVVSQMIEADVQCPWPVEGSLAPNGIMVTDEMLEGAELFFETARERSRGTPVEFHIEEQVSVPSIHPECFGTPDLWFYTVGSCHLEIFDYKFGHGFVDEWWNEQGLCYASGILEKLPFTVSADLVTVSFTVVQPRCFYGGKPVRTHNYKWREASPHISRLKQAAAYAYNSKPTANTGLHCDLCPGRHACDALQLAAGHAADRSSDRQPHDLTPAAAATELRSLQAAQRLLDARVDGLSQLTEANIRAGARVPHYSLEAGRGRTEWTLSPEQIITMGQLFGKDLSKPKVITPAQAAKNNLPQEIISAYTVNTPGSLKLVQVSNSKAAKAFGSSEG